MTKKPPQDGVNVILSEAKNLKTLKEGRMAVGELGQHHLHRRLPENSRAALNPETVTVLFHRSHLTIVQIDNLSVATL